MEAPLVAVPDETATFFLDDTSVRLSRVAELAFSYGCFALLLYCRLLCPGGVAGWRWFEPSYLWVVIFLPLFVSDWRNIRHVKYLRRHRHRFTPHEAQRYVLIVAAECLYKVLLCAYLSVATLRKLMTLQFVMLPYTAGYILHFVLGHFVPMDETERPEGCNAVASLVSELGRFLQFVLIISLSLKVDRVSNVVYDWQAAFWPCWGLEGILILLVVLLLPVCIISMFVDRPRMLMLSWVLLTAGGLGAATFLSMYNTAALLDQQLCPQSPCEEADSPLCQQCHRHLRLALWPWLAFLPSFAIATMLLKPRLSVALHSAWYQAPAVPEGAVAVMPQAGEPVARLEARERPGAGPPPTVMFRVTPTYYARAYDPTLLHEENGSARGHTGGSCASAGTPSVPPRVAAAATASMLRASAVAAADPSTSILSARGATFADIVESEQLCFICYDAGPDAILLECGHAGMCTRCAEHLAERPARQARCPICRTHISMVMRMRVDLQPPAALFIALPDLGASAGASRPSSSSSGGAAPAASTAEVPEERSPRSVVRGIGSGGTGGTGGSFLVAEQAAGEPCDLEAGEADEAGEPGAGPTTGAAAPTAAGGGSGPASSTSSNREAAVAAAVATAVELGQPISVPPWPLVAKRHAIVVEPLPRLGRSAWRWPSLLRGS